MRILLILLLLSLPAGADSTRVVGPAGELEVKDAITVYFRLVAADSNPFTRSEPFSRSATAEAVAAPWGGGGVTGRQLRLLLDEHVSQPIVRVWARAPEPGADPRQSGGMIGVGDEQQEYYDAYVFRAENNHLVMFLDVEVSP